jgi:hypothetical protein
MYHSRILPTPNENIRREYFLFMNKRYADLGCPDNIPSNTQLPLNLYLILELELVFVRYTP